MNLMDIIESVNLNTGTLTIILFILASVVQVSPINVNPWTALGRALQNLLGITELKEDLMDSRRTRIIRFDDELINKIRHRKDMFDAILVDCDKYERDCKAHKGYVNSIANDSISHIRETYHDCKREDDFLICVTKEMKK